MGEEITSGEIVENSIDKVPEDNLENHSDLNIDAIYTSRLKRTIIPFQKSILNDK